MIFEYVVRKKFVKSSSEVYFFWSCRRM